MRHLRNMHGIQNFFNESFIECLSMNRDFDVSVSLELKLSVVTVITCDAESIYRINKGRGAQHEGIV